MEILLGILEKTEVNFFYPYLLFNETFWLQGYQKRVAIIAGDQPEWVGDDPAGFTKFYGDPFFLELLKSVKLTYFTYTKITFDELIKIFQSKNKFAVTDFYRFGDETNSPIAFANAITTQYALENNNRVRIPELNSLSKILAVKIYSSFESKEKINILSFFAKPNISFWENFLDSILTLDEAKNTQTASKINLTLLTHSVVSKNALQHELEISDIPDELKENIILEKVDLEDLNLRENYDYILFENFFSTTPTDIIYKYGTKFYEAIGRITVVDRTDPKEAVELVADLTSPVKDFTKLHLEDILKLDFEIIWKELNNEIIQEFLQEDSLIVERNFIRFSLLNLKVLVNAFKQLNEKGFLHIIDFCETPLSQYGYGIFIEQDGTIRTEFPEELYKTILNSFDDISLNYSSELVNKILASEILKNEGDFIKVSDITSYIGNNIDFGRKFFDLENFEYKNELKKHIIGLKSNFSMKKRNIMLLGIPTYLYNSGLAKLTSFLRKDPVFAKYFEGNEFIKSNNLNSYDKEFIVFMIPKIMKDLEKIDNSLFTNKTETSQNDNFIKILQYYGLNPANCIKLIVENWEEIKQESLNSRQYKLIEVTKN